MQPYLSFTIAPPGSQPHFGSHKNEALIEVKKALAGGIVDRLPGMKTPKNYAQEIEPVAKVVKSGGKVV